MHGSWDTSPVLYDGGGATPRRRSSCPLPLPSYYAWRAHAMKAAKAALCCSVLTCPSLPGPAPRHAAASCAPQRAPAPTLPAVLAARGNTRTRAASLHGPEPAPRGEEQEELPAGSASKGGAADASWRRGRVVLLGALAVIDMGTMFICKLLPAASRRQPQKRPDGRAGQRGCRCHHQRRGRRRYAVGL